MVGLEPEAFAGETHKLLSLSAENDHFARDFVTVHGERIHGVVQVGEAVHQQAPHGFAKFPEQPLAVLAQGLKMYGGLGCSEGNHPLGIQILIRGEKFNAGTLAREVGEGFGSFGSFHFWGRI